MWVCVCLCVCQVFEFLIRLHSADSSEEEEVFPFIHTLLHFDTREFLNVLAMVRFPCVILTFVMLVNVGFSFNTLKDWMTVS